MHAGEGEEAGADPGATPSGPTVGTPTGYGTPARPSTARSTKRRRPDRDTNYYVGDYTVEPENGGLGVFAHEFAHDLGLPDYYDTAGGENGTGFWTLMSWGSWLGDGPERPRDRRAPAR